MKYEYLRPFLTLKAIAPVALLSLLSLGIFIFLELAEEIGEGEALGYDEHLLLSLRNPADLSDPIGPPWLEEIALELTSLGGYPIIALLTLAVAGYLAIVARRWAAIYVLGSIGGGALLSTLLKVFFERPRPDIVEQLDVIHTASFPSGHAMVGTVTYLTLGALVVRFAGTRREAIYILSVVAFIAVTVGLTRVYLGVHWPSDVIAGWALGTSWAAFIWCLVGVIEHRAAIHAFGTRAGSYFWGPGVGKPGAGE
jgi:undecaprenyl-diphosphatase